MHVKFIYLSELVTAYQYRICSDFKVGGLFCGLSCRVLVTELFCHDLN